MKTQFYTYIYHDGSVPFYVGKGTGKRAFKHLKSACNKQLHNKLKKMQREGREPNIEIHYMPSEESALELEVLWIALFGREDLNLGPLLNRTDGGEGTSGHRATPETLAKRSASLKKAAKRPETLERKTISLKKAWEGRDDWRASLKKPETLEKISKGVKEGWAKRIAPYYECPHCGKIGSTLKMLHWHFDNCKRKA